MSLQHPVAPKQLKAKFDAFTEKTFSKMDDGKLVENLVVGNVANILTLITLRRGRPLMSTMSGSLTTNGRRYVIFATVLRNIALLMFANEALRRRGSLVNVTTLKGAINELIARRARS